MTQKQFISVCIITKNESPVLKQCLENLSPHLQKGGHELVIVDTGSEDDTVTMCRAFTDRIYTFPWINDFSAARNFAASKATHDWILCIDSDEFIFKWNEAVLQTMTASYPQAIGGFSLYCTCGFGEKQYESKSKVYRLYNRRYFQFERPIHEQLMPFDPAMGHPTFLLDMEARHFSYAGDAKELAAKSERNIRLLKEEFAKNPHDPYLLFQLGQSYYMIEDFETALHYYDLALAEDIDPRLGYVNTLVVSYGYTLLNLRQYRKALELEGVYDVFGNRADFVFLMGMIYLNNGFLDDAVAQFEKATTFDEAEVVGANSFRAWHNLGVIYECAGYPEKAKSYYEKCKDFAPAKARLALLTNCPNA